MKYMNRVIDDLIHLGSSGMQCYDVIPYVAVDPYSSLAAKHKLPYSYSFVTDFYGNEFVVREIPRRNFFKGPDPSFKPLSDPDWIGGEYEIGDVLPIDSIATPIGLSFFISKKMRGVDTLWVSIPDRLGEKSTVDCVLEGATDAFREFGIRNNKRKSGEDLSARRAKGISKKKKKMELELKRAIA